MSGGTAERLALTLAEALGPLANALAADNLSSLLSQLGLELPAGFTPSAALTAAAQAVANAATQLPARALALDAAIDADAVATIITEGTATLNQVRAVLTGIDTLATQLPGQLTAAGISAADASAFAGQLAERLFSYAVVRYLEDHHALALGGLGLAGIIDRTTMPNIGGPGTHLSRGLRLDRLGQIIGNPGAALQGVIGWGTPAFDGHQLLARIADFLQALVIPVAYDETTATLQTVLLTMTPTPGAPPRGIAITNHTVIPPKSTASVDLTPQTRLDIVLDGGLPAGLTLELRPPGDIRGHPASELGGQLRFGISRRAGSNQMLTLLGFAGGVGIRAASIGLYAATDLTWNAGTGESTGAFGFGGDVRGGKLTLDFSKADGFIGKILSAVKLDADLEFGFDWSVDRGLRFRGSSALEIKLPAHLSLGPVAINALTLGVGVKSDKFPVALLADLATRLGLLDIVVQEVGLDVDVRLTPDGDGNAGPVDLTFDFHAA